MPEECNYMVISIFNSKEIRSETGEKVENALECVKGDQKLIGMLFDDYSYIDEDRLYNIVDPEDLNEI